MIIDVLLDLVDDRTKVANGEQSSESIEAYNKGREQKNAPLVAAGMILWVTSDRFEVHASYQRIACMESKSN